MATFAQTFPFPFDPYKLYFKPFVYIGADAANQPCAQRFNSAQSLERRCSIAATNSIIRLINCEISRPLRETPNFHNITSIDSSSEQKVRVILQKFSPIFPLSFDERPKNTDLIETINRTSNILRSFYQPELRFIVQVIKNDNSCTDNEALDFLLANAPNSLITTVAIEVNRQLQERNQRSGNSFHSAGGMISESLPKGYAIYFNTTAAEVLGAKSDDEALALVKEVLSTVAIPPMHRQTLEILLDGECIWAKPIQETQAAEAKGQAVAAKALKRFERTAAEIQPEQPSTSRKTQRKPSETCNVL